jgi:hypothetical protein
LYPKAQIILRLSKKWQWLSKKYQLRVRSIINLGLVARRLTGFLPPPITDEYPSLAPASVSGLFLYWPLLATLKLRRSFAAVATSREGRRSPR